MSYGNAVIKGYYTRDCRTYWCEINKGNESAKHQQYKSPPQDGKKQQRQKMLQKEPFAKQYFRENPSLPEDYYQKK